MMAQEQTPLTSVGMDRKIERRRRPVLKLGLMALGVLVAGTAIVSVRSAERTLTVDDSRVVVSDVTTGRFDDAIPVRGAVTPLKTIYLDAVEGGLVEAVHVESGDLVRRGQLLVTLSNTSLQLDVIAREAQITEQLNSIGSLELAQEQSRLAHRRELVELDYQLTRLGRSIERQKRIEKSGAVAISQLDDLVDERDYYTARREVTLEAQASDERMQRRQLEQLRASTRTLQDNLVLVRQTLAGLNVAAPGDGQLTAFDLQVGQSLQPGERIGQIDDPAGFKVVADIDEFYLGRVDIGQKAALSLGGRDRELSIARVDPQVNAGRFRVEMTFDTPLEEGIRRGQTLQLQLTLGDPTEAVLIPNGSFYQDTGGSWIFVVSADGSRAIKRPVRLGRRNVDYIEVLDGLEPGERVITSPYTSFVDMQRIDFRS